MTEDIIIDDYHKLTLGKWIDIQAIYKDETLEDIDAQAKVISIITGMDENDILDLPILEYRKLAEKTTFLTKSIDDSGKMIAKSYKVSSYDLIPTTDIRKLTTAQFVDFQTFHQAGLDDHLPEILSCLLVPKGHKYNRDYDIIDVQKAIKEDMSVHDAMSVYAFFLTSSAESVKDILSFSIKETKRVKDKKVRNELTKMTMKAKTLLTKNGDGSVM